ncbi:MAG TPA: hypothetical protein VEM15_17580 [Thermodesulfobacteriota bacterium]|nr:hypothetical protein [Thermodesulfobacteriota bacterium]
MNVRLPFIVIFLVLSHLLLVQTHPCLGQHSPKDSLFLLAKNGEGASTQEDSKGIPPKVIDQYEKEKVAKMEQNVGRRLMTAPTVNPAEFYASPDDPEKKVKVKREKEGFTIEKVVQNRTGTMNFYQVKFDSGETGYLAADGNNLEIRIKEGSLISAPKKVSKVKRGSSPSKARVSQAVELVKNHATLTDPTTGKKRSVEMRMVEEKARSFPNLKWRYEAKEIGTNTYRVTQYSMEGAGPPLTRTWIVDFSTKEVNPENLAAKEMYRQ